MKRRSEIKVEVANTDLGPIEIMLTTENQFRARVGELNIFGDSITQIKSRIYTQVRSLLHIDFRPVIEIHGTTLRDNSGSYSTESSIRTSFFIYANRYHMGKRTNDGGATYRLCRIDWEESDKDEKYISWHTRDFTPFGYSARFQLGISHMSKDGEDKAAAFFETLPAIYVSQQELEFEILVDYTPEFWEFLNRSHVTVMKLYDQIRNMVTDPAGIKKIESGFHLTLLPQNP